MAWPCDRCGEFAPWFVYEDGDSICVPCQLRARAIRAVVAAQFADAVAWACIYAHYDETARLLADGVHRFGLAAQASALHWMGREMAALPTPEQVVDGTG